MGSEGGIGNEHWEMSGRALLGGHLQRQLCANPVVGNSLDLIKIVSLILNLTKTPEEVIDVFTMAVTTTLEDHRVFMLQLLILKPFLVF